MGKLILLMNMIREFGVLGTTKIYYWKEGYRTGKVDSCLIKKMYVKSIGREIYFRPYTTDIILLIHLLCRPTNENGMEYNIDLSIIGKNVNYIIDAGANIGLFTLLYRKKFPNAKFICIEPDEKNFNILEKNLGEFSNVKLLCGGIWKEDSFLKVEDRGTGEWGFCVEECMQDEKQCLGYSVEHILKELETEKVDIFKIDIEGSEEVLFAENYEKWIEKCKCYIIEVHDRIKPGIGKYILNIFKKYNFRYTKSGENFIFFK